MKIIFVFAFIYTSIVFCISSQRQTFLRTKKTLINKKNEDEKSKEKVKKEAICKEIYKIGLEYSSKSELPKAKPSDFEPGKLVLFTKIRYQNQAGYFTFSMHDPNHKLFRDAKNIKEFFESHQFPPKYNWFELKECCLKRAKYEEKDVFEEVCFNMIYAFITYRYNTMVFYVERAFQEGIRNQNFVFSEVMIQKGTTGKDEEPEFEKPDSGFAGKYAAYIASLKKRLEQGCAISVFVPSPCANIIRVCPFFYDREFTLFNPNALEEEKKKEKSMLNHGVSVEDFLSFACLDSGYYIVCSSENLFAETVLKDSTENGITRKSGEVPDFLRQVSMWIYYFGSVTATSDLDFTVVTFQSTVIKNFQFQTLIINNYNNRFSNNMFIILAGKEGCFSPGDCFDTNAYITGFIDSKFKTGQITGIDEIDDVFRNEDQDKFVNFNEVAFAGSSALGMMALVDFWEEMQHEDLTDYIEGNFNISMSEGILPFLRSFKINDYSFQLAVEYYASELTNDLIKFTDLLDTEVIEVSTQIASKFQDFYLDVSKNMMSIKKIKSDLDIEFGIKPTMSQFEKSVVLNQIYIVATLDAGAEISHVKPDPAIVIENYKIFVLMKGTALMYANEAYFNIGGIRFQTNGNGELLCTIGLEAAYMIMGYSLLHYYVLYPAEGEEENIFFHGDALLKLAKYFQRVMMIVMGKCLLMRSKEPISLFYKEFDDYGFIVIDITNIDELGENAEIPKPPPSSNSSYKSRMLAYNMNILTLFSNLAMRLKKKYGTKDPLTLYEKVIKLESIILVQMEGYVLKDKRKSIGVIANLANFILTSITFEFYVMQNIWDYMVMKLETIIKRKVAYGITSAIMHRGVGDILNKNNSGNGLGGLLGIKAGGNSNSKQNNGSGKKKYISLKKFQNFKGNPSFSDQKQVNKQK